MSVRDVEDAVLYKLWKEHYEFVECGKAQVRRGRATTPYRMRAKVNTKIPSPSPGGQGEPPYSLPSHEYLPKTKSPVQAKKLVPDFLYYTI